MSEGGAVFAGSYSTSIDITVGVMIPHTASAHGVAEYTTGAAPFERYLALRITSK